MRRNASAIAHTNGIKEFLEPVEEGINGTCVALEPFHHDAYVTEQVFRNNSRATKDNPLTDADRLTPVASQISGKRLTHAGLTGKVRETSEPF